MRFPKQLRRDTRNYCSTAWLQLSSGLNSSIATAVGQQASDAQTNQNLFTQQLAQAQAVQTQISGVSLNAEAIQVTELQQGYDAAGKLVSVIDSLATDLMNMFPSSA